MNEEQIRNLMEVFNSFSGSEKKEFIESFAQIGGVDVKFNDLCINSKVIYLENNQDDYNAKVEIPYAWLEKLGITRDENSITIKLNNNKIVINKNDKGVSSEQKLINLITKEQKRINAKQLIEKGKKEGNLTLNYIMETFSESELDKDQVESLTEILSNMGINLII